MAETDNPLELVGMVNHAFAWLIGRPSRELAFAAGQLSVLVALKKQNALPQEELAPIARVEQPSAAQLLIA